jgi:FAD/FMN-containing dehydrogenase
MSGAGLLSWGNYPPFPQKAVACHWRGQLPNNLSDARKLHGTTLAYGSGLSYGDSCLAASGQVLDMRPLDHFLTVNWETGVLAAEAGVTFADILAVAIPHGWFLPVTPGTQYITLGGAIANDVHGKNHYRRGTFGSHVRRFGLLRSDIGRTTCSSREQPELFRATIGGLGLTGLIEWAEIQLMPIRSSCVDGLVQRFGDLDEFFALSAELDRQHEFCVSWIDCAAKGKTIGRGIYMAGDFAGEGPLAVTTASKLSVPFAPPVSLINRLSTRVFNSLYWRKAPAFRQRMTVGYDSFFYPLDAILNWNRIYGTKGFQQYQALIPEREARAGIRALLAAVAEYSSGSTLAVLKRCGDIPSPGLLSFPQQGMTLALDFPHTDRLASILFPRLDAIVREAGGRMYPAKDAHMSAQDFKHSYPAWRQIEAIRDPALESLFWQRVTR